MDPFERLNKPRISEDDRLSMAWEYYLSLQTQKKFEKYSAKDLARHSFKKTDEFVGVYLEEYS